MTQPLPFGSYIYHDRSTNARRFHLYANHLKNANFKYFADAAQNDRLGFLFTVRIGYNHRYSKFASMDLSGFPQFLEIAKERLSCSQSDRLKGKKIRSKLVSTCFTNEIVTDFIGNLSYSQLMFSAEIYDVLEVVTFQTFDFLRPHVTRLARHRATTKSEIMKKTCKSKFTRISIHSPYITLLPLPSPYRFDEKSHPLTLHHLTTTLTPALTDLTNSICGKLHTKMSGFYNTGVVRSYKELISAADRENFYDFLPIGRAFSLLILIRFLMLSSSLSPSALFAVFLGLPRCLTGPAGL